MVVVIVASGCGSGSGHGGGNGGGDGDDPPLDPGGGRHDGAIIDPRPGGVTDPEWPAEEPLPPEFAAPPWLTMPRPDHVAVGWITTAPTTGAVHAGSGAELDSVVASTESGTLHHAELGPLHPATTYRYEVVLDGSGARRGGVFVTPGMSKWRFIHLAEFHAPSRSEFVARFGPAVRAFRPHLVVDSGDMVDAGDSWADWLSYLNTSSPWISNTILLPVHSNHVNGFAGNTTFRGLFALPAEERWYSTRFGQVEFLTLDSTAGVSPDVDTVQIAWLAAQAAAAHDGVDDPALLIGHWHYPGCSSHFAARADTRAWVMQHLIDPLVAAGGIDMILVGHDKYFERSTIDGTIVHLQVDTGQLSPGDPGGDHPRCATVINDTNTRTLGLFEISGPRLDASIIDADGRTLDSFYVQR